MNQKISILMACSALILALTACTSVPGANNSAAGGTEPVSPAIASTSQAENNSPTNAAGMVALETPAASPAENNSPTNAAGIVAIETPSISQPGDNSPYVSNTNTPGSLIRMRVLWTVSGYVQGKNSTLDEQAARALLFKPLDITDNEIIFNGQACQGVTFQKKTVAAGDYLAGTWQTTPQGLGIEDKELQVIQTNCSLSGFQQYMRLGDGRLIVPINGVFFFFEPNVAK